MFCSVGSWSASITLPLLFRITDVAEVFVEIKSDVAVELESMLTFGSFAAGISSFSEFSQDLKSLKLKKTLVF